MISLKVFKMIPVRSGSQLRTPFTFRQFTLLSKQNGMSLTAPANFQRCLQSSDVHPGIIFTNKSAPIETGVASNLFTETENPSKHSPLDVGLMYRLSDDFVNNFSLSGILMKQFTSKSKAFCETALLIREHAVEVITILNNMKPTDLAHRIVLYGKKGTGKSASFVHCIDAAQSSGWLIVTPIQSYNWNIHYRELAVSNHNTERYDLPQEAVTFLLGLRQMNNKVLAEHGDTTLTAHQYTWSRREVTPAGTAITQLLDFGIERPKYACDVVGAFLKELRLNGKNWPFKTLVAIDGVNSFFGTTDIKVGEKRDQKLPPRGLSLVHHLIKLLKTERTNGAVLTTVDQLSSPRIRRESYLPKYLLGDDGFEVMDPFLPIEVPFYDHREIHKVLDYLSDKHWLQTDLLHTDHGRKELIYMSAFNPRDLEMITRSV